MYDNKCYKIINEIFYIPLGTRSLRYAVNIKYTADFKDFTPTKIMENNLNFILLYVERIMCVY